MGYLKAEKVLPEELLSSIQQYVDGAYIYIPRLCANKKAWGELKGSKAKLAERNSAIARAYRAGRPVRELAEHYCLSDKAIYKVLSRFK